jgi:hypothetical protein
MKLRTAIVTLAALSVWAVTPSAKGQIVERAKFAADPEGLDGELRYDCAIDVGGGRRVPVSVTVTVRRNGTFKVANLSLRVWDEHDDGQVYEDGLLHVEFVDVTGDGFRDLVITGIVRHTGEKERDPVTREPVTSIYVYEPAKREFRRTFHRGPNIDI